MVRTMNLGSTLVNRSKEWMIILLSIFVVVAIVLFATGFVSQRLIVSEVEGTITDKYIKRVDQKDVYHVSIRDTQGHVEVYQNKDALWWWKWNSATIQAQLEVGHTYRFTVTGFRVPLFSGFQNIVEVEEFVVPAAQ